MNKAAQAAAEPIREMGATGLAANDDDTAARPEDKAGNDKRAPRTPDAHIASALRSAYEEAVSEDVPDEFLDLLKKLT